MAIRKNTKRIDPRYFMDEKTDVVKEGADSSGHIDAWLIRLVADLGPDAFKFDPEQTTTSKVNLESATVRVRMRLGKNSKRK